MAEKKNIQIELIETNKGQIEGVPANPRVIKDKKFKKLVKSIEENPEMLDLREILVYHWFAVFWWRWKTKERSRNH